MERLGHDNVIKGDAAQHRINGNQTDIPTGPSRAPKQECARLNAGHCQREQNSDNNPSIAMP